MKYGVRVAWMKSVKRPTKWDTGWHWEETVTTSNVRGDIKSVQSLIHDAAKKYQVPTGNINISATYSNSLDTPAESDVVADLIAPCENTVTGDNWILIEASEVNAVIDSVK